MVVSGVVVAGVDDGETWGLSRASREEEEERKKRRRNGAGGKARGDRRYKLIFQRIHCNVIQIHKMLISETR